MQVFCKRAVQLSSRNQFHHVSETLVHAANVLGTTGYFYFDQPRQAKNRKTFNRLDVQFARWRWQPNF